jgi:hypothetical protein
MNSSETDPEIIKLARQIFSADQKHPGTIEVLSRITQSGLLNNPEDLTDLKTIIDVVSKKRKK